jgi:hypothetical protein
MIPDAHSVTGAVPGVPLIESRQWFTLGGLVPLSAEDGQECGAAGISYAERRMSGVDILVYLALTFVGAGIGSVACDSQAGSDEYSCFVTATNLVPFLLGSRTVSYYCAAQGAGTGTQTAVQVSGGVSQSWKAFSIRTAVI